MTGFKKTARRLTMAVMISMLLWPISMTGCSKRYVVVEGEETVVVRKAMIDQLLMDNELLLKALEECQNKP